MADALEVNASAQRATRMRGLYAITPDTPDASATARLCEMVDAALAGGASVLQYRNKMAAPELRRVQAYTLAALCARRGAAFIVNDHLELACQIGGAGLHVGVEDFNDLATVRRALGPHRMLGVSCYASLARAREAVAAGADYVAFGSVFASRSKSAALRAPLELFREARELGVPLVGIGGITVENLPQLIAAGADAAAVIDGLFGVDDVRERACQLLRCFDRLEQRCPHEIP